jgi:hypothetical protein
MSDIKKGALVKVWDDNPDNYFISNYIEYDRCSDYPHITNAEFISESCWKNIIEIPPEIAAQLDALGR